MIKILFTYFLLFGAAAFTACDSDEKIENYKSNEILIVTLEIEEDMLIEKATLKSSFGSYTDSISRNEIGDNRTLILKCPQKGEGTFSVCVFTKKDTICSAESYTEGGYRPRLKLKDNIFETIKEF